MIVRYYFDAHVPRAVAIGLRQRGLDILTAQEDVRDHLSDQELLERATALGRVMVTQDADFPRIGVEWQKLSRSFSGIIHAHQLRVSIGEMIEGLVLLGSVLEAKDWHNRIEFLPLR